MKAKPVVRRALAQRDVADAITWYVGEGGQALGLRFIDALEQAIARLGRSPAAGSPRYAHELGIEGLWAWPLRGFPYLVFYRDAGPQVDVWRVLHAQRDIPAWMRER